MKKLALLALMTFEIGSCLSYHYVQLLSLACMVWTPTSSYIPYKQKKNRVQYKTDW